MKIIFTNKETHKRLKDAMAKCIKGFSQYNFVDHEFDFVNIRKWVDDMELKLEHGYSESVTGFKLMPYLRLMEIKNEDGIVREVTCTSHLYLTDSSGLHNDDVKKVASRFVCELLKSIVEYYKKTKK